MTKTFGENLAAIKGNAALFIPVASVGKFAKNLSTEDQALLEVTAKKLATKYFFLGEFVFELENASPELFLDEKPEDKPDQKGFSLVRDIMRQNKFDVASACNYNTKYELGALKRKSFIGISGTGRHDAVYQMLIDIFGTDEITSKLECGRIDLNLNEKILSLTFNHNANTNNTFSSLQMTPEEVADAIDYSIKRALGREFLRSVYSRTPTDQAVTKYNPHNSCTVDLNDQGITVHIPLSNTVCGTFGDELLTVDKIKDSLSREINLGIQIAAQVKQNNLNYSA